MKTLSVSLASVFAMIAASAPLQGQPAPAGSTNGIGPRIQFATPSYDFGRQVDGRPVKADYVFTNTGDATLEVPDVKPGCGCTVVGAWTKQVEPGQTGVIPIEFKTDGYGRVGGVGKSITVFCNDKNQPQVYLQLHGTVWRLIDYPDPINMTVIADSPTNTTVVANIVNNMDELITLSEPEVALVNPGTNFHAITAKLETVKPGKEFKLICTAVPPFAQDNVLANIRIKTSSTNAPMIATRAFAVIQAALAWTPTQVALPARPVPSPAVFPIQIRYNGSVPMTLSEPAVNGRGAGVQLREVVPGREFMLTATFPAGFEISQGESIEITVKTSNPKNPVIKIPVIQPPPPRAASVNVPTPPAPPAAAGK